MFVVVVYVYFGVVWCVVCGFFVCCYGGVWVGWPWLSAGCVCPGCGGVAF